MSDAILDELVALALKLSVAEQAKLLERVAANLAREVNSPEQSQPSELEWTNEELTELFKPSEPRTGKEIAAMLQSGELGAITGSETINPDISDPVEWVKALRREMAKRRYLDWDDEWQ